MDARKTVKSTKSTARFASTTIGGSVNLGGSGSGQGGGEDLDGNMSSPESSPRNNIQEGGTNTRKSVSAAGLTSSAINAGDLNSAYQHWTVPQQTKYLYYHRIPAFLRAIGLHADYLTSRVGGFTFPMFCYVVTRIVTAQGLPSSDMTKGRFFSYHFPKAWGCLYKEACERARAARMLAALMLEAVHRAKG